MPKQIQVDNQIIEFPDEMSDNEIEAVIKREFYSQPKTTSQPIPEPTPQEQPKMGRMQALATTATNVPFAPRIKAGLSALTAKTMGGDESIGQFYNEALGNELSKLRQAREQYPVQSFASQLASDIVGGGTALKAMKLGGTTVKQALAGGAVLGGLSAGGETQEDLISLQGATDVATGGLIGSAGGLAGQQLGKAIGQSVPFVKGVAQRFRKTTPEVIMSRAIKPEEALQQATKLSGKIQEGRITTLPEQGNESILGLTRILGKTQGSNKIIKDYLENKTAGSAKRVGDIINKNISAEGFFDTLDNTIAKRKEIATPLYKKAYEEGANIGNNTANKPPQGFMRLYRGLTKEFDPKIKADSLDSPTGYSTWTDNPDLAKQYAGKNGKVYQIDLPKKNLGVDLIDNEGERVLFINNKKPAGLNNVSGDEYLVYTDHDYYNPSLVKNYQSGENNKIKTILEDDRIQSALKIARRDYGITAPNNSVEALHGARQVVDDIIGSAKRAGENNKARSYIDLKNKINNVIYDVAPTMKEADKTFSGFSALKNAQEEGLKFNQYRNGEEVKRAFSKLSDGEKETFRIGVKDYLMDKVAKSSDRNPAKAIFGNQLERRKIQALFDNPKQFTDFTKRLNDEIRVFDTKQRVLGGSRTDFNLEEQNQLLDKIAQGAVNAKTFGVADVLLTAKNLIQKKYYGLNEQTAKQLAEIMIDPEKSVNLLNNVYKKAQTDAERGLIQRFTQDYLAKRNFTRTLAPSMGRAMATEQLKKEENQNGI